ncbi:hypothetical protein CF336_g3225 [Tilletia laevis]|nr:hypothetical protein CF336_g3225 [Tilletia laevis]
MIQPRCLLLLLPLLLLLTASANSLRLTKPNCPSCPDLSHSYNLKARAGGLGGPLPLASHADILDHLQWVHGYNWARVVAEAQRAGLDRYSELSDSERVYVDQLVAAADNLKSAIINVGTMIDQRTAQERLARQAALARQAELDRQAELARQQNGHH